MKKENVSRPKNPKEIMHEHDPLDDAEDEMGESYSSKLHQKSEKPTKLPKKIRSGAGESYRPLRRK